jgi:hypothetical protein
MWNKIYILSLSVVNLNVQIKEKLIADAERGL